MGSTLYDDRVVAETHENQGGVEIFVVVLHVLGIVLGRLPFVHGVEIEFGVIVLDGLEEHPQGILDAISSKFYSSRLILHLWNAPFGVDIDWFWLFLATHRSIPQRGG